MFSKPNDNKTTELNNPYRSRLLLRVFCDTNICNIL